jgi:hypothetical protein
MGETLLGKIRLYPKFINVNPCQSPFLKVVMTKVKVQPGSCGFSVSIKADKGPGKVISLTIESDCEMVRKMAEDIKTLDRFVPLASLLTNPVYRAAAKHLKHAACPVPSAVLKAIEVEAGLNVAKDATIVFQNEK